MDRFLQIMKYLRRTIISFSIVLLFGLFILSQFYFVEHPNEMELIEPVDSFISQDDTIKAFLDDLEEFTPQLQVNEEEFTKSYIFD